MSSLILEFGDLDTFGKIALIVAEIVAISLAFIWTGEHRHRLHFVPRWLLTAFAVVFAPIVGTLMFLEFIWEGMTEFGSLLS